MLKEYRAAFWLVSHKSYWIETFWREATVSSKCGGDLYSPFSVFQFITCWRDPPTLPLTGNYPNKALMIPVGCVSIKGSHKQTFELSQKPWFLSWLYIATWQGHHDCLLTLREWVKLIPRNPMFFHNNLYDGAFKVKAQDPSLER